METVLDVVAFIVAVIVTAPIFAIFLGASWFLFAGFLVTIRELWGHLPGIKERSAPSSTEMYEQRAFIACICSFLVMMGLAILDEEFSLPGLLLLSAFAACVFIAVYLASGCYTVFVLAGYVYHKRTKSEKLQKFAPRLKELKLPSIR